MHICTTLRHTAPGVPERFVADLEAERRTPRARDPAGAGGMAPVYGMAAQLPDRGAVAGMMKAFVDLWYKP